MATDRNTADVYYFGEDVDNYKKGKVVSHDSAWRAGANGARFGLMIPARPALGQMFYQEVAPKIAMDRVEVVSIDETVKTAAGAFEHCIHLRETTPLERDIAIVLRARHRHRQRRRAIESFCGAADISSIAKITPWTLCRRLWLLPSLGPIGCFRR